MSKYATADPTHPIWEEYAKARENNDAKKILEIEDRLLREHDPLVKSVVGKHYFHVIPFEDALQYGRIGLLNAIRKFDPLKNKRLSTHASWWIRSAVNVGQLNDAGSIRVPVHLRVQYNKIMEATRKLVAKGFEPTPERISSKIDLNPDQIKETLEKISRADVLRLYAESPQGARNLLHIIKTESPSPEKNAEISELRRKINCLPPLQRDATNLQLAGYNLREISEKLGITKEWVRQKQIQAVRNLRKKLVPPATSEIDLEVKNRKELAENVSKARKHVKPFAQQQGNLTIKAPELERYANAYLDAILKLNQKLGAKKMVHTKVVEPEYGRPYPTVTRHLRAFEEYLERNG